MKMLLSAAIVGALLSTSALAASAAKPAAAHSDAIVGDAAAGSAKAAACVACHGPNGVSANPLWPNLAGQGAAYTASQLAAFKSGARKDAVMAGMAAGLSEQDMADLGAHFAKQPARIGSANPDMITEGQAIYRSGDNDNSISACAACHGPAGKGVASAGFPQIAGQHAVYVTAQLKAYRSAERGNAKDPKQLMMQNVAKNLTDAQIDAVSSYIEGLN